jgi:hypothetical protein
MTLSTHTESRKIHVQHHPIMEAASERLRKSPYTALRCVWCEYDAGTLTLRGRLPSFFHKQLAQVAVAGLAEVAQVVNQIEVEPGF